MLSRRSSSPFLPLNCGAITPTLIESELFGHERGSFTGAAKRHKGYFERAHQGTLFLDEIGEMPAELQVKLLRVLETGELMRIGGDSTVDIDVRVLAATNRDPQRAVEEGKLREDLLYRLSVFPVRMPPLRERGDDIELLADHFLAVLNERNDGEKAFSDEARKAMRQHPGRATSASSRTPSTAPSSWPTTRSPRVPALAGRRPQRRRPARPRVPGRLLDRGRRAPTDRGHPRGVRGQQEEDCRRARRQPEDPVQPAQRLQERRRGTRAGRRGRRGLSAVVSAVVGDDAVRLRRRPGVLE
jgi:hypothetical protein